MLNCISCSNCTQNLSSLCNLIISLMIQGELPSVVYKKDSRSQNPHLVFLIKPVCKNRPSQFLFVFQRSLLHQIEKSLKYWQLKCLIEYKKLLNFAKLQQLLLFHQNIECLPHINHLPLRKKCVTLLQLYCEEEVLLFVMSLFHFVFKTIKFSFYLV